MRVRSVVAVLGTSARAAAFVGQSQPSWWTKSNGFQQRASYSSSTVRSALASEGSGLAGSSPGAVPAVPSIAVEAAAANKPGASQIFCNRELALRRIEAIGFDMDYTIAQYLPAFDLLAYEGSQKKLVEMGYPAELLDMSFEPEKFSRGLVLDKQLGNVLKIDRYKYVRVAQHGSKRLSREERRSHYTEQLDQQPTYTGADYVNVDTQFQIVDANLFTQLVDLKDKFAQPPGSESAPESVSAASAFLASKSYADLFKDIRHCVDMCHRDGVIKDQVALDPAKYIVPDPNLFPMLQQFQLSGKKVFLLTNSFYDYTDVAMTFLLQEHRKAQAKSSSASSSSSSSTSSSGGVDEKEKSQMEWAARGEWVQYFDLVIVGSCKPAFMLDSKLPLFRIETPSAASTKVNTATAIGVNTAAAAAAAAVPATPAPPPGGSYCGGSEYWLRNTDGVGSDPQGFLAEGRVFQGGNFQQLHEMLEVAQGDRVLYVGDHTYSDILRSKRTLGWRTCLVIPELEVELNAYADPQSKRRYLELQKLKALQRSIDDEVDAVSLKLYRLAALDATRCALEEDLERGDDDDDDDGDDEDESVALSDGVKSESASEEPICVVDKGELEVERLKAEKDLDGTPASQIALEREMEAEALADVLERQRDLKAQVLAALQSLHSLFHLEWGQLFKAGHMDSRFAKQVADYACIYATRASDLGGVSPSRDFRPADDLMPHDVHGRSSWQLEGHLEEKK